MDEPTRRAWSKPELIVLVRSGPEEAVLEGCKTFDHTGTTVEQYGGCYQSGCNRCGSLEGS